MYSRKKGFTLVELLVVIAIIGLLSTFGAVAYNRVKMDAKVTKAEADLVQIRTAITILALDTNEWPGHQTVDSICTSCSGNEICNDPSAPCANTLSSGFAGITQTDNLFPFWNGPYIGTIPLDPWGNEYFLDTDYQVGAVNKVVLGSYGPNGGTNNVYNDGDNIILIIAE